jgi:hypothetical protein
MGSLVRIRNGLVAFLAAAAIVLAMATPARANDCRDLQRHLDDLTSILQDQQRYLIRETPDWQERIRRSRVIADQARERAEKTTSRNAWDWYKDRERAAREERGAFNAFLRQIRADVARTETELQAVRTAMQTLACDQQQATPDPFVGVPGDIAEQLQRLKERDLQGYIDRRRQLGLPPDPTLPPAPTATTPRPPTATTTLQPTAPPTVTNINPLVPPGLIAPGPQLIPVPGQPAPRLPGATPSAQPSRPPPNLPTPRPDPSTRPPTSPAGLTPTSPTGPGTPLGTPPTSTTATTGCVDNDRSPPQPSPPGKAALICQGHRPASPVFGCMGAAGLSTSVLFNLDEFCRTHPDCKCRIDGKDINVPIVLACLKSLAKEEEPEKCWTAANALRASVFPLGAMPAAPDLKLEGTCVRNLRTRVLRCPTDPPARPPHVNIAAVPSHDVPIPPIAVDSHNPPLPPSIAATPPAPPKVKKRVKRQPTGRPVQPQSYHSTAASAAVIAIIGGAIAATAATPRPRGPSIGHTGPAPRPRAPAPRPRH